MHLHNMNTGMYTQGQDAKFREEEDNNLRIKNHVYLNYLSSPIFKAYKIHEYSLYAHE